MKTAIMAGIFVLVGGIAIAEAAVTGTAPVSSSLASKIGMGALGGVIAAFVGWMKNRDVKTDTQEAFDFKYMVSTVVVGAILGAIGAWRGIGDSVATLSWAEQSALWACIVAGGEMALKAIFRQGAPRLADILKVFKK